MTRKIWAALSRFWESDHGLSILLALLVVVIFVLPLFGPMQTLGRIAGDVIFSLLLISGAATVSRQRLTLLTVSVITTAAIFVRWASWLAPSVVSEEWRRVSLLASLGLLSLMVLTQVFREGPITFHRVRGAMAVYLLLGLTWALAYEMVAHRQSGAFTGAVTGVDETQQWVYYSFVTLTTAGYGDVTPVHPIARSLAMLEALTGQLYPAILLARLVSLEVKSRKGD
jgi:Ion channel